MNKTSSKFVLLACILVIVPECFNALNYTVCDLDKSLAEVKSVLVNDCDSLNDPCTFIRGFNKSIELNFVPKQKVGQVKVKLAGKIKELPLPFRVNPDEACGNYGFDCPLEADQAYKFKMSLPILRTYPKLSVDVFLRLVDEKGEILNCVRIPAQIRDPQKVE